MRLVAFTSLALLVGCTSSSDTPNPTSDAGADTTAADSNLGEGGGETFDDTADETPPLISPVATPADPAITCPVTIPADTLATQRAACAFNAGATTASSLGVGADVGAKLPIRHVIVMMRENRAFDHLLGTLHDLRPDVEAIPAGFSNPDSAGVVVPRSHATTTCIGFDPDHQWVAMHDQVDNGKMDGFVKSAADTTGTDGHFVMTFYDPTDIPFEYWLAETWPINDRHFASARTGTFPDRLFMLLGTNDGIQSTGLTYPDPSTPTIFDALNAAGFSWGVFSDGSMLGGALNWDRVHPGSGKVADLLARLDAGTLPNVSFVDGNDNVSDDHPEADIQVGEAWTQQIYDHAIKSPQWNRLAMVWT
ncbi:MAG: alkaline phosphatase family protein, partial [Polyangiales bacterium]